MFFAIRLVGWGFLAVGFIVLVRDLFGSVGTDHGFHPRTLGDLWNMISPGTVDDLHGWILFRYGPVFWWPLGFLLNIWGFAFCLLVGFGIDVAAREREPNAYKRSGPKEPEKKSGKAARA